MDYEGASGAMDGHVRLWSGTGHKCMLGFTLLLLLFEIVVSRLCNCLINMVDGFHTLYILLHLSLQQHWAGHTPPHSSPPLASPAPSCLLPSPDISSSNSHSTSHPDPSFSSTSSTPGPCLTEMVVGPIPAPTRDPTSSLSGLYVTPRVQPFGVLVSALLVASLCVSVMLEILNHIFQPHPIQRPVLATVASALSLLFNTAVLSFTWAGPLGAAKSTSAEPLDLGSDEKALTKVTEDKLVKGTLPDGSLLFCNPAAPSVLDPDSNSVTTPPDSQGSNHHEMSPSSVPEGSEEPPREPSQSKARARELTDHQAQVPMYTGCTGYVGNPTDLCAHPLPAPYKAPSTVQQSSCVWAHTTILRDLLCPCLALANALTALLGTPDCHPPQESCNTLVYLDPAFSMVAVLVLLACTLPEVQRLGLLLLQSCPPGFSVPELRRSLTAVHGVERVHELHVWQLTEGYLVASVHVHVNTRYWWEGPDKVVAEVTAVLRGAGVSLCTVQPELATEHPNGEPVLPAVPCNLVEDWPCSLPCRKECLEKMCCSSLTKKGTEGQVPPSSHVEEKDSQAVIIENTFL